MHKFHEFIDNFDPNKYYLELHTDDLDFCHGKLNVEITLDGLVQLVDIMLLAKDGNLLDVYNDEPGLFKIDSRNAIILANKVKGFSPNGKFHRTKNLVSEIIGHEANLNTHIYQTRNQDIDLLIQYCQAGQTDECIRKLINYLRATSISVSISDIAKIMNAYVFDQFKIDPEIQESINASFNLFDNNEILYYFSLKNGCNFIIGKNFSLTIYQPDVDLSGSLLQEKTIFQLILEKLHE